MISIRFFLIFAVISVFSMPAWSTRPLIDRIELEGSEYELFPKGKPWLDYPENDKTLEIHQTQQCSAIGGLRATWLLKNDQLWLTGFFTCGRKVALSEIYAGSNSAKLANWINDEIAVERGKILCIGGGGFGPIVTQTTTWLTFKAGA
jgi:hypothetical protein